LRTLFLAGERLDSETYEWVKKLLQIPVIDHWWQTESGWPMLGINDTLRGQRPVGFIVLKDGLQIIEEELEMALVSLIRDKIRIL
jgi:acyl-coenzyme A synthetase/AMP-(fatty) acid ligase